MSIGGNFNDWKYLGKSEKYKRVYVYQHKRNKNFMYKASVLGINKFVEDEREAARIVDIKLMNSGKEPLNIFKRKK